MKKAAYNIGRHGMELRDRKKKILKAVIESYINTAEPVGSKALAEMFENAVSSATLRNEMSELEEMGYLEKPHVSAGRVPSWAAYRFYVDELMEKRHAIAFEIESIRSELDKKVSELDDILVEASKIVSRLTSQTGVSAIVRNGERVERVEYIMSDGGRAYAVILMTSSDVKSRMIRLPFDVAPSNAAMLKAALNHAIETDSLDYLLPSLARNINPVGGLFRLAEATISFIFETEREKTGTKVHIEGAEKILNMREYQDTKKAHDLMEYLSGERLYSLLSEASDIPVCIRIGPELDEPRAKDASFVFTSFPIDENTCGIVGVVAPTRMDYGRTIEHLQAFKQAASSVIPHKKGDK